MSGRWAYTAEAWMGWAALAEWALACGAAVAVVAAAAGWADEPVGRGWRRWTVAAAGGAAAVVVVARAVDPRPFEAPVVLSSLRSPVGIDGFAEGAQIIAVIGWALLAAVVAVAAVSLAGRAVAASGAGRIAASVGAAAVPVASAATAAIAGSDGSHEVGGVALAAVGVIAAACLVVVAPADPWAALDGWRRNRATAAAAGIDRPMLLGVSVARAVCVVWTVAIAAPRAAAFDHGRVVAIVQWAAAAAVVAGGVLAARRATTRAHGFVVAADVAIAAVMVAVGWRWAPLSTVVGNTGQLWGVYPWFAAGAAGVVGGWRAGTTAAGVLGAAIAGGAGWAGSLSTPAEFRTVTSMVVGVAAVGVFVGLAAARLRVAELEVAEARARDQVARRLHDGVLQTLAAVARRSDDAELVALARHSDGELREFLRWGTATADDVTVVLRRAAMDAASRFAVPCEVVVLDYIDQMSGTARDALAGAVGEAVANAAKHASASKVTVCITAADDGGVEVTVVDDGVGIGDAALGSTRGLVRSMRTPVEAVGGRVEIRAMAGGGTEVRLWVP